MDKEEVVYIYTMEYYAAIKRNEIWPFAMTWMELEGIKLREIRQSEKDNYPFILLSILDFKKVHIQSQSM